MPYSISVFITLLRFFKGSLGHRDPSSRTFSVNHSSCLPDPEPLSPPSPGMLWVGGSWKVLLIVGYLHQSINAFQRAYFDYQKLPPAFTLIIKSVHPPHCLFRSALARHAAATSAVGPQAARSGCSGSGCCSGCSPAATTPTLLTGYTGFGAARSFQVWSCFLASFMNT